MALPLATESELRLPEGTEPLGTHETDWDPQACSPTLNIALDACIVPTSTGEARLDTAHVVVLDDFFGEAERQELLAFITQQDWDHSKGPPEAKWERATADAAYGASATWGLKDQVLQHLIKSQLRAKLEIQARLCKLYPETLIAHMPSAMLQNREAAAQCSGGCDTAEPGVAAASDAAAAAAGCEAATVHAARPSGPASQEAVRDMRNAQPPAQPQMHAGLLAAGTVSATSRHLAASQQSSRDDVKQQHTLLPPPLLQDQAQQQQQQRSPQRSWEDTLPDANQASASPASDSPRDVHADCSSMLANAAMHGDAYRWHVDADPWALAESSWTEAYGHYFNRERGKPLFVSLLLYLDLAWGRELDAETLFLDTPTDTGVVVRPKAYRAVLLDQDVLHRLSPPSVQAGTRPRYSLVWKLVFFPRHAGQALGIARPEWGPPCAFGSAAKAQAVMRQLRRGAQAGKAAGSTGVREDEEHMPKRYRREGTAGDG